MKSAAQICGTGTHEDYIHFQSFAFHQLVLLRLDSMSKMNDHSVLVSIANEQRQTEDRFRKTSDAVRSFLPRLEPGEKWKLANQETA
jgi:hypothetical protein